MFCWLVGLGGLPRTVGAQGWPVAENAGMGRWIDTPYGCPPELRGGRALDRPDD